MLERKEHEYAQVLSLRALMVQKYKYLHKMLHAEQLHTQFVMRPVPKSTRELLFEQVLIEPSQSLNSALMAP